MSETESSNSIFSEHALAGRVYGITGGSKGIGAAVVAELLTCGASVFAMAREPKALAELAARHASNGSRLICEAVDVSDATALENAINQCAAHYGRIDGWVNNAMFNPGLSLEASQEEDFERAWHVNTLAAWRSAKWLLPHFKQAGGGSIVNVSSIMAHQTTANQTAYTSSKAGLEGLTRALAVELAPHRIRVNALAIGYVLTYSSLPPKEERDTPWQLEANVVEEINSHSAPWPQATKPADAAKPIIYLLSDAARVITGTTMMVDAGLSVDLRPLEDSRRLHASQHIAKLRRQISELQND